MASEYTKADLIDIARKNKVIRYYKLNKDELYKMLVEGGYFGSTKKISPRRKSPKGKEKQCPPGKILNKYTNKCIKVGGPTYNKLVKEGKIKEAKLRSISPIKNKEPSDFEDLPTDVLFEIGKHAKRYEFPNLCQTSKAFEKMCRSNRFWYQKFKHERGYNPTKTQLELYKSDHLRKSGIAYIYPSNRINRPTILKHNVNDIAYSTSTTFLLSNGKIYAKGSNTYGQLGNSKLSEFLRQTETFKQIKGFSNVDTIACSSHTTAFISSGKLYTFGNNEKGQLGHGTEQKIYTTPTKVKGFNDVIEVVCSLFRTVFLRSNGDVYYMGMYDKNSPDSYKTTSPKKINISDVITISCSDFNMAFVTKSGELYITEKGDGGVYGDFYGPRKVGDFNNVMKVSCGYKFFAFITSNNELYSFGTNTHGQLGHGKKVEPKYPKKIENFDNVIDVSCGRGILSFITSDGRCFVFGQLLDMGKYYTKPLFVPVYKGLKVVSGFKSIVVLVDNS